jgi:hypothetical protein
MKLRRPDLLAVSGLTCLWAVTGCGSDSTTRPSTIQQRQDAALRDPFGYKMEWHETVSGGDMTELKKDELKRDLKNVIDP